MDRSLDELYQVSQAVLSVTRQMSVRDVLQVIVRSARSLVGARYAALGVPDQGDSFAEFVVDGISDAEWAAIGPLPRRHGMLAVLLNQGKPERLPDIRKDPQVRGLAGRPPEDVALPRRPGPRRRPRSSASSSRPTRSPPPPRSAASPNATRRSSPCSPRTPRSR